MAKRKPKPSRADSVAEVDFSTAQHDDLSAWYQLAKDHVEIVPDAVDATRIGISKRRPVASHAARVPGRSAP